MTSKPKQYQPVIISLILVDLDYKDPQERKVSVTFQNKQPKPVIDNLRQEELIVKERQWK